MAENKKQHYVPQFYLRLFSEDKSNIYSYHLDSKKSIKMAIKNICQSGYFYSVDIEYEKILGELEGRQSTVLKKIVDERSLNNITPEDNFYLLQFILLQYARTKQSKEMIGNSINELFQKHFFPHMQGISDPKSLKVKVDKPHFLAMNPAMMGVELISDLLPILVVNETKNNFITSDAPVVLYNHVKVKAMSLLGFQSPGLQIYCPLNNNLLLLFIDTNFYDLKLSYRSTITLENCSDVDAINKLQFFSALHSIIYSDEAELPNLIDLHSSIESRIVPPKMSSTLIKSQTNANGDISEIIKTSKDSINYHLKLSFLKLNHQKNRIFKHQTKGNLYKLRRNKEICDIVDKRITEKYEEMEKRLETE